MSLHILFFSSATRLMLAPVIIASLMRLLRAYNVPYLHELMMLCVLFVRFRHDRISITAVINFVYIYKNTNVHH